MSNASEQVPLSLADRSVKAGEGRGAPDEVKPAAAPQVAHAAAGQPDRGAQPESAAGTAVPFDVTGKGAPAQIALEFEQAKAYAEYLQRHHANAAQCMGHVSLVLSSTEPYWTQLGAERNQDPSVVPALQSGVATVVSMKNSLAELCQAARSETAIVVAVNGTAAFFGSNTAASSSLFEVSGPTRFKAEMIPAPEPSDGQSLANRLSRLDPALGRVCEQIWQDLYGTTADPERGALFMLRQTWDHLFDTIAPDDEVRKSSRWTPKPSPKPELVTREERIMYALDHHVVDPTTRGLLVASSKQMTDLYQGLNRAHTRGDLDKEKARRVLRSVYDWFKLWADALGL